MNLLHEAFNNLDQPMHWGKLIKKMLWIM